MGCCLEKLTEEEHVPKKKSRPEITLIPPSDDEKSDEQHETSFSSKEGKRMVALYDYTSREAGDLSFQALEEFDIIKGIDEDWCYVTRLDTGEKGFVPRNFICFADSLQSQRWFFGTITRKDSENLLLKMNERGSFLIRESETSENSYSLSLLNENGTSGLYVKHYRIRYNNHSFFITDGVEFSKLSSLIDFYQDGANGLCCQLTKACTFREVPQTYSLAPQTTTILDDDVTSKEKLNEHHQYSVTHKCIWKGKFTLAITEYKVATGMAYLETIPFAHRYLRACNIAVGEGPTYKVAEYGTCASPKDVDSDAIFWLSMESLESDEYDIKADVWSYGVLVAEILCNGENPYTEKEVSTNDLLGKLKSGYRVPQPHGCPDILYELMVQCWDENRASRPTFEYIQIFMESFFQRKDVNGSS